MRPYQIIYKGFLDTGPQSTSSLLGITKQLKQIDLPWDTEIVFEIGEDRGILSLCALLEGKEIQIREAMMIIVQAFPETTGTVFCYGDHSHDVRRFIVRDARIYEQKTEIEYTEPGFVIFNRT